MLKTSLILGLLAIAQAQAPQTPPQTQTSTSSAAAQAKKPAILEVHVTDRTGTPLDAATVTAEGPLGRKGDTDRNGSVTFKTLPAGTYRFRIDRDKFFTLEKEVIVKGGTMATIEAALSAAPPPPEPPKPAPAPPPPAPKPVAPTLTPGEPKALSLPDFIEAQGVPRTATKEAPVGCSGATSAKVIQVRDALASHNHAAADEMLYLISGEATVKLGDKEYGVTPGWFVVVPRGMDHTVTRKGRNAVTMLSIVGGPSCAEQ